MLRRMPLCLALLCFPAFSTAVDSIGITVSDLDRSVEFYTTVLVREGLGG